MSTTMMLVCAVFHKNDEEMFGARSQRNSKLAEGYYKKNGYL